MAAHFEVAIVSATLARSLNRVGNSEVYATLSSVGQDDKEKVVARTVVTSENNLSLAWEDQEFACNLDSCKLFKFRLFCYYSWWPDFMCGEAHLSVAQGRITRSFNGEAMELELLLHEERTGSLTVAVTQTTPLPKRDVGNGLHDIKESWDVARPADFEHRLRQLLDRPLELEVKVRERFHQLARPGKVNARPGIELQDMEAIIHMLAEKLGVRPRVFGQADQIFWRFEFSGERRLFEDEAVRAALFCLRQYRDATGPPRHGVIKLGHGIEHRCLGDRYKLGNMLGEGGQGTVFKAKDKKTNNEVVLKTYSKLDDNVSIEEITEEFEVLMTLRHPKIARVFDVFQDGANVYMVQEPYYGGDLTTALDHARAAWVHITERWLAGVFKQVLLGVEFLHSNFVIHSDLKEANVMVACSKDWNSPQVVIIDFGLVNQFNRMSHGGGTPGYIPPEVWERALWTPRGDVFSTGVMLHNMAAGTPGESPFTRDAQTIEDVQNFTLHRQPRLTRASTKLQDLVNAMLQKSHLRRVSVQQIMVDPWFTECNDSTALGLEALEEVRDRRRKTDLFRAMLADIASRENLAQLKTLNKLFSDLDSDNDGLISAQEARTWLNGRWSHDEIERLIDVLIGSNETVSYEAFMGQLIAVKEPEENRLLAQTFAEVDTGKTGFLQIADVRALLQRPALAKMLGDRSPENLMSELDTDGDGQISFSEFKYAMQGEDEIRAEPKGFRGWLSKLSRFGSMTAD
uniref:Calmodulin n=1 Tax=Noctiluca scintillans TaxID=2966 RepID=A0A7S1AMS1_NOCSC